MATITVQECRNFVSQFARNAGDINATADAYDRTIQAIGDEIISVTRIIFEVQQFLLSPGISSIGTLSADFRPERVIDAYLQDGSPTVTFSGGGGNGAAANAVAINGSVNSINVTQGGWNYTSAPTVTLTAPYGSGAYGIATIGNGAVTGVTLTSPGSGYGSTIAVGGTGAATTIFPYEGMWMGINTPRRASLKIIDYMSLESEQIQNNGPAQPIWIAFETWQAGTVWPPPDQPYIVSLKWMPMFTAWAPGATDSTTLNTTVNIPLDIMRTALMYGAAAYLQNNEPTQRFASQSYQRYLNYLTLLIGRSNVNKVIEGVGRRWRW